MNRDIDFARRFDVGINSSLRRLPATMRVDRRSLTELNDRQTMVNLLKSKEYQFLQQADLKKQYDSLIKRLYGQRETKKKAWAKGRGGVRVSRAQGKRASQAYERGERRTPGTDDDVKIVGEDTRPELTKLREEIINLRNVRDKSTSDDVRDQLRTFKQDQFLRDASILQNIGGFNNEGIKRKNKGKRTEDIDIDFLNQDLTEERENEIRDGVILAGSRENTASPRGPTPPSPASTVPYKETSSDDGSIVLERGGSESSDTDVSLPDSSDEEEEGAGTGFVYTGFGTTPRAETPVTSPVTFAEEEDETELFKTVSKGLGRVKTIEELEEREAVGSPVTLTNFDSTIPPPLRIEEKELGPTLSLKSDFDNDAFEKQLRREELAEVSPTIPLPRSGGLTPRQRTLREQIKPDDIVLEDEGGDRTTFGNPLNTAEEQLDTIKRAESEGLVKVPSVALETVDSGDSFNYDAATASSDDDSPSSDGARLFDSSGSDDVKPGSDEVKSPRTRERERYKLAEDKGINIGEAGLGTDNILDNKELTSGGGGGLNYRLMDRNERREYWSLLSEYNRPTRSLAEKRERGLKREAFVEKLKEEGKGARDPRLGPSLYRAQLKEEGKGDVDSEGLVKVPSIAPQTKIDLTNYKKYHTPEGARVGYYDLTPPPPPPPSLGPFELPPMRFTRTDGESKWVGGDEPVDQFISSDARADSKYNPFNIDGAFNFIHDNTFLHIKEDKLAKGPRKDHKDKIMDSQKVSGGADQMKGSMLRDDDGLGGEIGRVGNYVGDWPPNPLTFNPQEDLYFYDEDEQDELDNDKASWDRNPGVDSRTAGLYYDRDDTSDSSASSPASDSSSGSKSPNTGPLAAARKERRLERAAIESRGLGESKAVAKRRTDRIRVEESERARTGKYPPPVATDREGRAIVDAPRPASDTSSDDLPLNRRREKQEAEKKEEVTKEEVMQNLRYLQPEVVKEKIDFVESREDPWGEIGDLGFDLESVPSVPEPAPRLVPVVEPEPEPLSVPEVPKKPSWATAKRLTRAGPGNRAGLDSDLIGLRVDGTEGYTSTQIIKIAQTRDILQKITKQENIEYKKVVDDYRKTPNPTIGGIMELLQKPIVQEEQDVAPRRTKSQMELASPKEPDYFNLPKIGQEVQYHPGDGRFDRAIVVGIEKENLLPGEAPTVTIKFKRSGNERNTTLDKLSTDSRGPRLLRSSPEDKVSYGSVGELKKEVQGISGRKGTNLRNNAIQYQINFLEKWKGVPAGRKSIITGVNKTTASRRPGPEDIGMFGHLPEKHGKALFTPLKDLKTAIDKGQVSITQLEGDKKIDISGDWNKI